MGKPVKAFKKRFSKESGGGDKETDCHISVPTDDESISGQSTNRRIYTENECEYFRAVSVLNLAIKMREGLSERIKDRRWRSYKVYKSCFLHKDAISWLMENQSARDLESEEEEEKLLQGKEQTSDDDHDDEHDEEMKALSGRNVAKSMRHAGLEMVHALDNVTGTKAHTEKTPTSVELENEAVKLGNRMIDAGYVSHVTNEHRFRVGENHTLFFHFHNDLINSDRDELHRQELLECKTEEDKLVATNKDTDQEERKTIQFRSIHDSLDTKTPMPPDSNFDDLKLQISRMSHMLTNVSTLLDDSKAKIIVLETTIRSLTLMLGILSYLILSIILFNLTFFSLEVTVQMADMSIARGTSEELGKTIIKMKVCVFVILATGGVILMKYLHRANGHNVVDSLYERVKDHMAILNRIASDDIEGKQGLLVEIEQYADDDSVMTLGSKRSVVSSAGPKVKESSSVRIMKSLSSKLLSPGSKIKSGLKKSLLKPVRDDREVKTPELIVMREASDIPIPSEWPHRPVMLCANTPAAPSMVIPKYGDGTLPIGVPFHFRSDLFEGQLLVRMKDLTSDDPDGDAKYFMGRKRVFQYIVQGRFLEEIPVSEVLAGHEFVRPLKKLPPSWILKTGISLIERLAPGLDVKLNAEQPYALAYLASTAQAISGDMPGNEPDIRNNDIREDLSILGGIFKEGNISAAKRKKHLMVPKNASKYTFDTESVYTFDFYQNLLDMKSYSLDLGFTKIGLTKCLDGQPAQIMSKTGDGRYLFSFQIWHEKLLSKKKKD